MVTSIWLKIVIFFILAILLFVIFLTSHMWFPGFTAKQTVNIILFDHKYGGRAANKAIRDGSKFFESLEVESHSYSKIDMYNSILLSEIVRKNKSDNSQDMLNGMYMSDNYFAKLVAINGQVRRKPEAYARGNNLIISLIGNKQLVNKGNNVLVRLAVKALGTRNNNENLPLLLNIFLNNKDYFVQVEICNALKIIGGKAAHDLLKNMYKESSFIALREGFIVLAEMDEKHAIELAINKISPSLRGTNSGLVVVELESKTGKKYGYDKQKWLEWYANTPK